MTASALDTFSLGDTVRLVLAEQAGEFQIQKLCAEVEAATPPEHLQAAYQQALPRFVADICRRARQPVPIYADPTTDGAPEQVNPLSESKSRPLAPVHDLHQKRPAHTTRAGRSREYWRQLLDAPWPTDHKGGRARLADLSFDQLRLNIEMRQKQTRADIAETNRLISLEKLMVQHGVNRLGNLPEAVLRATLTPTA